MSLSTLGIVFTQDRKTIVFTGLISIRESVTVTVADGAALIASGLVLKIQNKYNNGETTPIATLSTWTADGVDAVGTMNTNTTEAIAEFVNAGNQACKPFNALLFATGDPSLQANGSILIKNFPSSVTTDPVTIDQAATIAENTAAILLRVAYADFSGVVDDPTSTSSIADNRAKLIEILAILRND